MEDLVPFLIFIVIALVNLVKYILEKGAGTRRAPAAPSRGPQRKGPASLEEFFETLAEKMGPKPTGLPDWPEGYERPDYMKELEEYERAQARQHFEEDQAGDIAPAAENKPVPAVQAAPLAALSGIKLQTARASLKAAVKTVPTMGKGLSGMQIATAPMLRSSAGRIDYALNNKADLRNAIIANVIFSPPRAYDTEFENSIIK